MTVNQVRPNQESFNAGEFGKKMHDRVQFDKYVNAAAIMENILPLPQGGFTKRPGTRYVADPPNGTDAVTRLIPFQVSVEEAYVLAFSNGGGSTQQVVHFYKDQGVISTTASTYWNDSPTSFQWLSFSTPRMTDASNGTGSTAQGTNNGFLDFGILLQGGGSGNEAIARYEALNVADSGTRAFRFAVFGDPGDEITVRIGTSAGAEDIRAAQKFKTGYHVISWNYTVADYYIDFENANNKTVEVAQIFGTGANSAISLGHPFSFSGSDDALILASLHGISIAQSADVMYMCPPDNVLTEVLTPGTTASDFTNRPWRLERYGDRDWSVVQVRFQDGPWLDENKTSTTLAPATVSGTNVTITASATTGINDDEGFRAEDVGRLIRIEDASNKWRWVQIVEFTDTTHVNVHILSDDFSSTAARTTWRLGEWTDAPFNGGKGWPRSVGFVQQRLVMADTRGESQKFWMSKSADIENFADEDEDGNVQDDSAISYRFAARQLNAIQWIASRKKPVIGTVGGTWTLTSEGAVVTPNDIAADFEVSSGVSKLQPIDIRNRLISIQAQGQKLLELANVIQESGVEGLDAFDLTILNDRVLRGGVITFAYQDEPDSVLYVPRQDGQVPTLTYQPEQQVVGWARQIIGGGSNKAVVESITTIPGSDADGQFKSSAGRTEVWVVVNRGGTRTVEFFEKAINGEEDQIEDAFYVDSGLTYDDPKTITSVTLASPGTTTFFASNHGLVVDDDIVIRPRDLNITYLKQGVELTRYRVASIPTVSSFTIKDGDGNEIDIETLPEYEGAYASSDPLAVRKLVTSVTGLDHLEGETVQVLGDGAPQSDKVVASGAITLDQAAGTVHVGLGYVALWRSLKLAVGPDDGSAVGQTQGVADVILSLMETADAALEVTTIEDGAEGPWQVVETRQSDNIDGQPEPLYDGIIRLGVEAGYDDDIRLALRSTKPLPFTVTGISPELEVNTP